MNLEQIEKILEDKIAQLSEGEDPAHDLLHFKRVVKTAKQLCAEENAVAEIVIPAAWLHDFVNVPKNDPRRDQASRLSGEAALVFLKSIAYPERYLSAIQHAIEAHSFSAQIKAETLEAKIVQDADRLDGLGAIGIARLFATAGILKSTFYSEQDPLCEQRTPNDRKFAVDHFFVKLFNTAKTLQTQAGRLEGERRVTVMKAFLSNLKEEL